LEKIMSNPPPLDRAVPDPDGGQSGSAVSVAEAPRPAYTVAAQSAIAALRIALGFTFLWAFLDKTFGLNYSTAGAKSWINGGSPTNGFLSHVAVGPFESVYHSIAGTWWANALFMLGLLAIGVALILGVAMKIAAAAGTLLLVLMWSAEWPLAQFTSAGEATGSSNPFVDSHLIYALAIIVLAIIGAGRIFGLGDWWAKVTGDKTWLR
jgi:thiosulfate dehydrogenase [quinone] large subunit